MSRSVAERRPVPMELIGVRNRYAESAKPEELLERYGLMPADIIHAAEQVIARKET